MPLNSEQIAPFLKFEEDNIYRPSSDFRNILPYWYRRVVIVEDRGLHEEHRHNHQFYIGVLLENDMKGFNHKDYIKLLTYEGFVYLRFYHFENILTTTLPPSMIFEPDD